MDKLKFAVIGGDLRNIKLADLLAEEGHYVKIYGFGKAGFELGIKESPNIQSAVSEADVVIGPLPCSNNDEALNAPFCERDININEVFKAMTVKQLFIAGRISEKIRQLSHAYNIHGIDIMEREEMAVLNAIPTAEGAIQIALEEMPITLHDSNALVLGFGRTGKVLAKRLDGMGANVYVEARKFSDIAWIRSFKYNPVHLDELEEFLPKMDVIFNTIPHVILDSEKLGRINKDCLVIDLASKPGGVDFEKAKEMGIKVIWALSLPGKVAPITAAKIIKDTVQNILKDLEV